MKLLPAPKQPIALLPARDPEKDKRIRQWWEDCLAKLDLKELLFEAFRLDSF